MSDQRCFAGGNSLDRHDKEEEEHREDNESFCGSGLTTPASAQPESMPIIRSRQERVPAYNNTMIPGKDSQLVQPRD